ncbi:MAG: hypothetical protein P8090_12310 [Gammaproteobacteria bacterium]
MIRSLAALALIGCVACTPVRSVPAISGTAHGGGLLVIGCRVWIRGDLDQRTRAHVDQGVLVIDGLLVFADLPPGRYRLALINASYHKGTTVAQDVFLEPPAMTDRLTFHVGAGKATYGGRLQIIGRLAGGADGGAFTLKQDRRLELQAWRKLLARYPHGSWAGTIRARVRTLQSAGH